MKKMTEESPDPHPVHLDEINPPHHGGEEELKDIASGSRIEIGPGACVRKKDNKEKCQYTWHGTVHFYLQPIRPMSYAAGKKFPVTRAFCSLDKL